MLEVIKLLIPIVVIGVGWYLARSREREKDRQDKRMAVYADMLSVMAKVERTDFKTLSGQLLSGGTLIDEDAHFFNDVIEEFNRTHLKLMVFGSPDVIEAVSEFYGDEMQQMVGEKKQRYIAILHAMREDGFQKTYPKFDGQVDNILISGPLIRRSKLLKSEDPERNRIL